MSSFLLAIVPLVVGLILLGLVLRYVKRLASAGADELRAEFPDAQLIIPNANFFGQESKGVGQMRGNGSMAITAQEIYFRFWIPRREFRISRSAIQSIENPRSFLSKMQPAPLLKVNYLDEQGQMDSMAWLVPNLAEVQGLLERR